MFNKVYTNHIMTLAKDINEITFSMLSEVGLNEYESRAYLTILEGGVLVAREISDRSSIPYAKVYQVLESLINKQLILGDEGRPKKFQSKSPKIALYERLNAMEKEWRENHKKREKLVANSMKELLKIFKQSNITSEAEQQGVWNIFGLSNIMTKLSKLFEKSEEIIRVTISNESLLNNKLLKLILGVQNTVHVKMRIHSDIPHDIKLKSIVQSKYIGEATSLIFDSVAQISIVETKKGKYSSGEYSAVLTQIDPIITSAILDFDNLFKLELRIVQ